MAGLRTATVQVVATATLAAVVAWGGLGRFIVDGFAARKFPQVFAGALLVALLALATELFFVFVERAVTPRTSSRERRRAEVPEPVLGPAA
jgi:osmoprotectant transport system permease protein